MYYVYLLRSLKNPSRTYIGYTTDLNQRLETHNSGNSIHTAKSRPWELVTCICFVDKTKAADFEKYLKSQSGRAFLHKRLV